MEIKFWIFVLIGITLVIALIGMWRPVWIAHAIKYIARDEMPIWLSVLLAISAAAGTYYIAPLINEDFEFQKNRSAHVLSTVTDMNKDITDLSKDVRRFNDSLFYKKPDLQQIKGETLDKITELQWRLIDVGVIIKRAKGETASITKLSSDLEKLQVSIIESNNPQDQEHIISRFADVSNSSRSTISTLYSAARLD